MKISGSIGITILVNKDIKVFLLADDHSSQIYCKNIVKDLNNKNHLEIEDLLKKELYKGNKILLEEVPKDNNHELIDLWPNSPHTQDLKNLFFQEDGIKGTDIRPFLVPFSWELTLEENEMSKISIKDYAKDLDNFFNRKGDFFEKYFLPVVKKIKIKNKGYRIELNKLKSSYLNLRKTLDDKPVIYYFNYNRGLLENISELCDEIMEYYTILNLFGDDKKKLIHTGLMHSSKIIKSLTNSYDFEIVYQNGINNINNFSGKSTSCISLPADLFEK